MMTNTGFCTTYRFGDRNVLTLELLLTKSFLEIPKAQWGMKRAWNSVLNDNECWLQIVAPFTRCIQKIARLWLEWLIGPNMTYSVNKRHLCENKRSGVSVSRHVRPFLLRNAFVFSLGGVPSKRFMWSNKTCCVFYVVSNSPLII